MSFGINMRALNEPYPISKITGCWSMQLLFVVQPTYGWSIKGCYILGLLRRIREIEMERDKAITLKKIQREFMIALINIMLVVFIWSKFWINNNVTLVY